MKTAFGVLNYQAESEFWWDLVSRKVSEASRISGDFEKSHLGRDLRQIKVQAFENVFRDFLETFITKIHFLLDNSTVQRPFSRFSKAKSPEVRD